MFRNIYALSCLMIVSGLLSACESQSAGKEETVKASGTTANATSNAAQGKRVGIIDHAEAALQSGDRKEAYESFSQALQEDPSNPRALIGMAETYLATGSPDKALPLFERVNHEFPDKRAVALQGEGIALAMLGRREESQRQLQKSVAINPTSWRALNALGVNYDAVQGWGKAYESYQRAITLNPASATIMNNQGLSFTMQGNYPEAEKFLRRAMELNPDSAVIRMNLRLVLARQRKYDDALAGVLKEQMPTMLNNVGYVAMMQGDYPNARQFFFRAMQFSPSYYEYAAINMDRLNDLTRTKKTGSKP